MNKLVQAVIALGSNLNEPKLQVQAAMMRLGEVVGLEIIQASSLYITRPVGYLDQPDFVNAVVLIQTSMLPEALLNQLLKIEVEFGRTRSFANAPRLLDLDLIDYNGQIVNSKYLTLPHPRAKERGFVMLPLFEIVPDYKLGALNSVREIVKNLSTSGIRQDKSPLSRNHNKIGT